ANQKPQLTGWELVRGDISTGKTEVLLASSQPEVIVGLLDKKKQMVTVKFDNRRAQRAVFLRVIDVEKKNEILSLRPAVPFRFLAFSPDQTLMICEEDIGKVIMLEFPSLKVVAKLTVQNSKLHRCLITPNNATLVTFSGSEQNSRVWDVKTGREKFSPKVLGNSPPIPASISPDGNFLAFFNPVY